MSRLTPVTKAAATSPTVSATGSASNRIAAPVRWPKPEEPAPGCPLSPARELGPGRGLARASWSLAITGPKP